MFDDDSGYLGGLLGTLIEPAGRLLMNQLTGNVALPGPTETLAGALVARLRAKYPDAPELELAGSD